MTPDRLFRNVSFRLISIYSVLFTISSSLLFGVIYWIASQALLQQVHDALLRETSALVDDFQSGGMDELIRSIAERLTAPELPPTYALLLDASGRKLAGNLESEDRVSGFVTLAIPHKAGRETSHDNDAEYGIIAFGRELSGGAYLLIGEEGDKIVEAKVAILKAFWWGMGTVLALSVAGGVLISMGFLKRIDDINQTTQAIMAGNLADRVPTRATNDELDQLAANLNAMLDRIQVLMDSLRQVSSDIAHDLRMPLSRLRQRLEGGKSRIVTENEYQYILDAAIADTDKILSIFSALLSIAQVESGARRKAFVSVDLAEVIATLTEAYGAVAEDRGQTLTAHIAPKVLIQGDRELLTQMFANLLENAIRHSPGGTRIMLHVSRESDSVMAVINDNGPGIPKEEWEKVFNRFYRLDRSRSTSGSGLGLALVKAIADLHDASLELSDANPGLQVCVRFSSWYSEKNTS